MSSPTMAPLRDFIQHLLQLAFVHPTLLLSFLAMDKHCSDDSSPSDWGQPRQPRQPRRPLLKITAAAALLLLVSLYLDPFGIHWSSFASHGCSAVEKSVYGDFPSAGDPFHFLPCTDKTLPPAINDTDPAASWAKLFNPDPAHWNWGDAPTSIGQDELDKDPYAGRGIYLCGYLDVPMDYMNESDPRISRQAITKYQLSGLKRLDGGSRPSAGQRSERTLVIEPGGPSGSGTQMAWRHAQNLSKQWTNGTYDVLGWDPRGVNASYPSISCFPSDAHRERWKLITSKSRLLVPEGGTIQQLEAVDAMNEAVFKYCLAKYGDIPRFVGTSYVARDLERIREALGEDELTAYMVSYGTGIAQNYAVLFPNSVGRMILDGNEFFPDYQQLGGFGSTSLDNVTDAWHDGFISECIASGPENCALAKSKAGSPVTVSSLQSRMETLVNSLIERPIPAYSDESGPALITYTYLVDQLYQTMYAPATWPQVAQMLYDLEDGNTTLALQMMNNGWWLTDPGASSSKTSEQSNYELALMVICAESYGAAERGSGLEWWDAAWANMTDKSWLSGDMRFYVVFPCHQFFKHWPEPPEVFHGGYDQKLKNPLLLISEPWDPATPLRNGRRLQKAFGADNARLLVHHGFGHGSNQESNCTNAVGQRYLLEGILPDEEESDCYANRKPFRPRPTYTSEVAETIWDMRIKRY